jgi:hypothetical protein
VVAEAKDWLPGLDDGAPTRDVWQRHFAGWGERALEAAGTAARDASRAIAERFASDHAKILDAEQRRLDDWIKGRAEEICGRPRDEGPTLFDRTESARPLTPAERLREFIADQPAGSKARSEAETVLGFHERSLNRLSERRALRESEPVPLGLLMLIPRTSAMEKSHGR